ncbi:MAG: hypothetical protein LDLANPLL_01496 [Turneriella sp.]|nr:hypothetical protein [Turneriella sp.]
MCDTFVANKNFTRSGNIIFGKNSDREPNEAQALVRFAAKKYKEKTLKTTFIEIPQAKESYEVILSKPFHMWGAEMGANQHGLVIGNEAVFTKIKPEKKNNGLTGMDMLRLALERKKTAEAALELITELTEQYGQDACGGYKDKNMFYSNSYIITDKKDAWVLETAGKQWAAVKVKDFYSISNGLTIGKEYDLSSKDLIHFAEKNNFIKKGVDFDFARDYSDWFFTTFSMCKRRAKTTLMRGKERQNTFGVADAMEILRTHNISDSNFAPNKASMGSVCMHSTGFVTPSQTCGSLVAELREKQPSTFWFTGTAAPCTSLFKPFYIPGKNITPEEFLAPGEFPDSSLWWRHEKLHRKTLVDYKNAASLYFAERNRIEAAFIKHESDLFKKKNFGKLDKFSSECLQTHFDKIAEWTEKLEKANLKSNFSPFYKFHRKRQNSMVNINA